MTLYSANWNCHECDAGGSYQNAHGVAVQHHNSTGHQVAVEEHRGYLYGDNGQEVDK